MPLGVRKGVVVNLDGVAALPEQVVLHCRDERLLPFAITLGELGRKGKALRCMQMPNGVRCETRTPCWRGPKRSLGLQPQAAPMRPEGAIRKLPTTPREKKRFFVS